MNLHYIKTIIDGSTSIIMKNFRVEINATKGRFIIRYLFEYYTFVLLELR